LIVIGISGVNLSETLDLKARWSGFRFDCLANMPYLIPPPEPPPIIQMGPISQQSVPAIASAPEPQSSHPPEAALPASDLGSELSHPGLATSVSPLDLSTVTVTPPETPPELPAINGTHSGLAIADPEAPNVLPLFSSTDPPAATASTETLPAETAPAPASPASARPTSLPTAAQQAQTPATDSAPAEDAPSPADPEDAPAQTYPRGATPEPLWSNGGVTNDGELLPPTEPTSRPDTPLDLTADYQEFEPLRQVVTARGNVVLRLGSAVLTADRLWANLENRYVLVEGNVVFERGDQLIRAERGEYNLLQGQGSLFDASGTLFLPDTDQDFADVGPTDVTNDARPLSDRLRDNQVRNARGTGGLTLATDSSADLTVGEQEEVRRIRFEAARVDFDAEGWVAEEVRLTNDPFSPPEFELRGDTARLTRISEFEDELYVENARAVFDQSFSVPLFRDRLIFRRGGTEDVAPVSIGYDGEDRDGLFLERTFRVATVPPWQLRVTPQFLLQRFTDETDFSSLDNLGLEVDLDGQITPTTRAEANVSFAGLDFDNLNDRLRASVRVQQALNTHTLNLEYSYRDRLFNGSLGFQDVQSSLGLVLLSPNIPLGDTGVVMNYQISSQYVTAETDRPDLLSPGAEDNLISLGRFQGSVGLSRVFPLWRGEPLPPTPDAGLRFTPNQVVPNVNLFVAGRGTYTYYTSEDTQESLFGVIGITGELGHFSRDFLDSTIFNLSYQRAFIGEGGSPFTFDRDVDQNVLSGGIIQQIYGPFRLGFQTSINLDTGENIDTDFILEYSRRTYGIVVRFNPEQASGFIGFRLSEFDWDGRAARFGGADIRQVEGGVVR